MIRTDEELVALATAGDLDCFNQLVSRWERPIYALAYRTLGREEDARDVVQEAFLRAFRGLKGFKGEAKFSSWLYRICLNLCRDWMRRNRRAPLDDGGREEGDGRAARRAAHRDSHEGVSRADVSGNCRGA